VAVRRRRQTKAVDVGGVTVGGGAPIAIQSMTDTDTADARATARQCRELAEAGADLVRIAVNHPDAARAVPEIRRRLEDSGCPVPLIGDFHFNGHRLLTDHPGCAAALDKYRINPGNVGRPRGGNSGFSTICSIARDLGKAVRIGVNGGSLDPELVTSMMEDNARRSLGRTSAEVLDECAIVSALGSVESAVETGLNADRLIVSCKVSTPRALIRIYRQLADRTDQPLHLGLTEAGMGTRGIVWSASAMGALLHDGIGDTIRVSLTPRPGDDRRDEVVVARELLQSLGLRSFAASVTSCPGCGRTTKAVYRDLAARVETHLGERRARWAADHPGAENLRVAVMGCVVNGPGESKTADIGISLPGTGEEPRCPVFVDGALHTTLEGDADTLARRFLSLIDDYVASRFPRP
jgi:(E)-4-hydroxy-3-methylbut-2-enyl-diphosphate synthase